MLGLNSIILAHYLDIYATQQTSSLRLISDYPACPGLPLDLHLAFCTKVTHYEIEPLKAPRPDGFHLIFFQRFWPTVGDTVSKFIKHVFFQWKVPSSINKTLICLIPKVANPKLVT